MVSPGRVKRALVLGASSDIGVAVCQRVFDAGHRVTGHFHRNPSAFESLTSSSGTFDTVRLDLANVDEVSKSAHSPDVTNADVVIFLAALANYLIMGAAGPAMASRGWGRIVIGSSIGVKFSGGTDSFNYALANHASEFIPRTARDWAASGVLTNVVRIGVTDTKAHDAFGGRHVATFAPMNRTTTTTAISKYMFWIRSDSVMLLTSQVNSLSGGE